MLYRVTHFALVGLATVALSATWTEVAFGSPSVASISPNNGPSAGGGSVKITGSGFEAGATVRFGTAAATSVAYKSPTEMLATSPAGEALVDVTVTDLGGTSPRHPEDQYAYDASPLSPWLGLNGNNSTFLGPVGFFAERGIAYDRGGEEKLDIVAGDVLEQNGRKTQLGEQLEADFGDGMLPIITIEPTGYPSCPFGEGTSQCLPTGTALTAYSEGFARSAKAIVERYPTQSIPLEVINEPYGYGTAGQYASIVSSVLNRLEAEDVPVALTDIYVSVGRHHWISKMYEAESSLRSRIQGWYSHPYNPYEGAGQPVTASENSEGFGIGSLPYAQAEMTSGQNNLIVSEVGYCDKAVNEGSECGGYLVSDSEAKRDLSETLRRSSVYHNAGWLKALLVYSRNAHGWAMQVCPNGEGSCPSGAQLTGPGEVLTNFATDLGDPRATEFAPYSRWIKGFGERQPGQETNITPLTADVTGDGKADAVVDVNGNWYVGPSTGTSYGSGSKPYTEWIKEFGSPGGSTMVPMLCDVTGDGKADAVVDVNGWWYVAQSTGTSFESHAPQWVPWNTASTGTPSAEDIPMCADVNGDGKADAIVLKNGTWEVAPSTGTSFHAFKTWIREFGYPPGPPSVVAMACDVTGDGKADAVVDVSGWWYVAKSTGSLFESHAPHWVPWNPENTSTPSSENTPMCADANGDGKADAIVKIQGTWWVAPSTGTSLESFSPWITEFGYPGFNISPLIADAIGEKRADAIADVNGEWFVAPSFP